MGSVLCLFSEHECGQDGRRSISVVFFFFFSSRRRHTRLQGDWSSDVCSSDLFTAALSFAGVLSAIAITGKAIRAMLFSWFTRKGSGTTTKRSADEDLF